MNNYSEIKKFIYQLNVESGKIIKQYFRKKVVAEIKQDLSPVTIADKKCEELIRERIQKEFPAHGIIGEEFGSVNTNAEYVWVLDPIDGTKSFISGALSFGTMIALMKNGEPVLGSIYQPILEEFLIGDNSITEINGVQTQIRPCSELNKATLLTTDHINIEKYKDKQKFENLYKKVNIYRMWGDCYGYYLLATGFADIMIDPIMSFWDIVALIPIIRGANGVITDWSGNDPMKGNSIIASSKELHKKVIEILNE